MTLTPIADSKVVTHGGYDAERQVLRLVFRNGKNYEYQGVSPEKAAAFAAADSKGSWIQTNLASRKGVAPHPFQEVPPLEEAPQS